MKKRFRDFLDGVGSVLEIMPDDERYPDHRCENSPYTTTRRGYYSISRLYSDMGRIGDDFKMVGDDIRKATEHHLSAFISSGAGVITLNGVPLSKEQQQHFDQLRREMRSCKEFRDISTLHERMKMNTINSLSEFDFSKPKLDFGSDLEIKA